MQTFGSVLERCLARDPVKMITDCRMMSWADESGAWSRNSSKILNKSFMLLYKT